MARIEDVLYPPLLWAAPVVPVIVLVVIARDASRAAATPRQAPVVRRSSTQVSGEIETAAGRALRARAASPQSSAHELAQIAWRHEHLRPIVAANPATPLAVLEWLSTHGDAEINAAIAARSTRAAGMQGPASAGPSVSVA
ncbi:hypothetical protein [Demequina sp. NBRC 110056]|uniref:variant leucine-rich repeat-containing protein n=1 Tax=Demequina sp. NBRC 110056 TaxID=1570345 RepID=UPI00117F9ED1|nr:hypothetical protein [Demequina sp. NBRC 110056]